MSDTKLDDTNLRDSDLFHATGRELRELADAGSARAAAEIARRAAKRAPFKKARKEVSA